MSLFYNTDIGAEVYKGTDEPISEFGLTWLGQKVRPKRLKELYRRRMTEFVTVVTEEIKKLRRYGYNAWLPSSTVAVQIRTRDSMLTCWDAIIRYTTMPPSIEAHTW